MLQVADLPMASGRRVTRSATTTPLPVSRDTTTTSDSSIPETHSSVGKISIQC